MLAACGASTEDQLKELRRSVSRAKAIGMESSDLAEEALKSCRN